MNSTRANLGRGAEMLVGLVYLAAAVLKAMDINLFLGQILAYQIFTSPGALQVVAFSTLALETFLGLSLVLGSPWRTAVLAVSAAMLLFFSGLIAYAWQVHGLEDCGCFGAISFTPLQAIGKNVVLLALNGAAWYGLVFRRDDSEIGMSRRGIRLALPLALSLALCAVIVPQLGGSAAPPPPQNGEQTPGPEAAAPTPAEFAGRVITTDSGETLDLGQGEYLVALLSMTCEHCRDSVPLLNAFTEESALPRLVAVCLETDEGSKDLFQAMTSPQFPMHSIGNDMVTWSKICKGLPPRLCVVRDGVVVASWNEEMPDYETLLASVGSPVGAETE